MRILLSLLLTTLFISCGTTYVDYDYDKEVDFSRYQSYNYDFTEVTGLSEFDERRFVRFTDSILQSRGLSISENPDLWVSVFGETYASQSRNSIGVGIGGGGRNGGVGVSGGIPIGGREENLQLTIDVYDTAKNTLVWQAVSDSAVKMKSTPPQRDIYFKKLVEKIFTKYPPKK